MEIRQLRYFVAVAEDGQFSRAAVRLGVAQSTISEQIRSLESELGTELLLRSSRTVLLTEAGASFLDGARRILDDLTSLADTAQEIGSGRRGRLRIGALTPSLATLIPGILQTYAKRFPAVEVQLMRMSTDHQLNGLLAGDLDVGFVRGVHHRHGVRVERLLEEPLLAVLPSTHRLAGAKSLSLSELDGETFIFWPRSDNASFYDRIIATCHEFGCIPGKITASANMETQMALISAGLGVSVQPLSFRSSGNADVAFVPVHDLAKPVQMQLAWIPNTATQPTREFVSIALETAQNRVFTR